VPSLVEQTGGSVITAAQSSDMPGALLEALTTALDKPYVLAGRTVHRSHELQLAERCRWRADGPGDGQHRRQQPRDPTVDSPGVGVSFGPPTPPPPAYPAVTGFTPTSGTASGGTSVTLRGSGFRSDSRVEFGWVPARVTKVISSTEIQAVTPGGTGNASIRVLTNLPVLNSAAEACYRYTGAPTNAPTVTLVAAGIAPTSGGTTATIRGTNFTSTSRIYFGYAAGTNVKVKSAILLTVTVPAMRQDRTVPVFVVTAAGRSGENPDAFLRYSGGSVN
jgi:hypothetical protein